METERIILTVQDVAKLLYCSEKSARTLMKNNLIKCMVWNGKEYRTTIKYVHEFIENMIEGTTNENALDVLDIVMTQKHHDSSELFLQQTVKKLRKARANEN